MGGKTYIGTFVSSSNVDNKALTNIALGMGAQTSITDGNDFVFISKPALLEFELSETAAKNYELKWKITPLVFNTLLQPSASARNVFLFRKSDIAFSGMMLNEDIISELAAAYKELV